MRLEKTLVNKLVKAMNFKKGEKVLINYWGSKDDITDLYDFKEAMEAEGVQVYASVLTDENLVKLVTENPEGVPAEWFKEYDEAESVVDMFDRPAALLPEGLTKEQMGAFGMLMREMFMRMTSKEKMLQITMPTEANAVAAGFDYESYAKRTIKALDIDYEELKKNCEKKIAEFEGNGTKRTIHTGNGCVLTMETAGRQWYIDAGEGSLPCGEIYIAPVEEKTNGTIFFETFAIEDEGVYNNITLTVENGKVIGSNCDDFNAMLKELPEGSDIVAELGIGMNPNVTANEGDSHLDEDALGSFHIAIGMNNLFGGKNECPFHMDFVSNGEIE